MEHYFIHLHSAPRLLRHPFPVQSIYYYPCAKGWVDAATPCLDLILVLQGAGRFKKNGRQQRFNAPCVFAQMPGVPTRWGSDDEYEILAISYDIMLVPGLLDAGLVVDNPSVLSLCDTSNLFPHLNSLHDYVRDSQKLGGPDRIDGLCELILMELRLAHMSPRPQDRNEALIRSIQSFLDLHYLERPDVHALARQKGLSQSNFRKQWHMFCSCPPHQYIAQLLMRDACRMLAETSMSVKEMAEALRFNDQLYFSKQFRRHTGQTASAFRAKHHSAKPG